MKKKFLFLLFLIFSTQLIAQAPKTPVKKKKKYVYKEIGISYNYSLVRDDNTQNKSGFGGFLYLNLVNKEKFHFKSGAEFNRTSQYKLNQPEGTNSEIIEVTYFISSASIPVFGRFFIGTNKKIFVDAGAYLDINTLSTRSGTIIEKNLANNIYQSYAVNDNAPLTSINYGPVAGIGYRIPIGKKDINLRLDAKYGLVNLYEIKDFVYNRYFRISAGYKF